MEQEQELEREQKQELGLELEQEREQELMNEREIYEAVIPLYLAAPKEMK